MYYVSENGIGIREECLIMMISVRRIKLYLTSSMRDELLPHTLPRRQDIIFSMFETVSAVSSSMVMSEKFTKVYMN